MAKRQKQTKEYNPDETQKRLEKYVKVQNTEKKSKTAVVSIVCFSLLCFIILLIIILKLSGVGKTVVFDTAGTRDSVTVGAFDDRDISGTSLADAVGNEITTTTPITDELATTTTVVK